MPFPFIRECKVEEISPMNGIAMIISGELISEFQDPRRHSKKWFHKEISDCSIPKKDDREKVSIDTPPFRSRYHSIKFHLGDYQIPPITK